MQPNGFVLDLFVDHLETQQKLEQGGPPWRSPPLFNRRVKNKARTKPALGDESINLICQNGKI